MTESPAGRFKLVAISLAIGFVVGAAAMAVLVVIGERRGSSPAVAAPGVTPPGPVILDSSAADLRQRKLALPVLGTDRATLHDSFDEVRGGTRKHEAIDILAPRNTPIVAVEDGTIARLLRSDAGGITIYQFDPSTTYVYYYAHLDHYAAGLTEGKSVRGGEIIGYVGVTGNAPKDTPHLHFAIFKLTAERKWWQGTPVDPYGVLK